MAADEGAGSEVASNATSDTSGEGVLGGILAGIVQQLRDTKMPFGYPEKMTKIYELVFGKVPSIEHAPDYHTFVPLSNVVILPEMQKKAKAGRYLSLEHFRADLYQLHTNAVAYNSPGDGGGFGDPQFIKLAARLLEDARVLIAAHLPEIQAAEARIAPRASTTRM